MHSCVEDESRMSSGGRGARDEGRGTGDEEGRGAGDEGRGGEKVIEVHFLAIWL